MSGAMLAASWLQAKGPTWSPSEPIPAVGVAADLCAIEKICAVAGPEEIDRLLSALGLGPADKKEK